MSRPKVVLAPQSSVNRGVNQSVGTRLTPHFTADCRLDLSFEPMERTTYFMIRIRRLDDAPEAAMAGVLEQIDSGRKRRFESSEELLRLLGELSGDRRESSGPGEQNQSTSGRIG